MDSNILIDEINDSLNIGEIEKQKAEENNRENREEIKRRNVKFIKVEPDFDEDLTYFAVNDDGKVFPDLSAIKKELKKSGTTLYVFDGTGLPYAYKNTKGNITRSDEPISSEDQLPGSSFTPMKSALPEDIVAQGNANRFTKYSDLRSDATKLVSSEKERTRDYEIEISNLNAEISKLEKQAQKIASLPKEPSLEGGITKPTEPVKPMEPKAPVEPVAPKMPEKPDIEVPNNDLLKDLPKKPVEPIEPLKPREPAAPFKPVEPKKPEVMVDLEATKDLTYLPEPELKVPVDPGPAPSYSKFVLFLSRLFLGRDSQAYTRRLEYDARKNAFDADTLAFPEKKKEYDQKKKEFDEREQLLAERNATIIYNRSMEKYKADMKVYQEEYKVFEENELKPYQESLEKYNEEFNQYKEEYTKFEAASKEYENALKNYEKETLFNDADRKAVEKEYNEYVDKMKEYDDAASKYDVDYEKYQADSVKFKTDLEQYEKDANEYEKQSKQYEEDLKTYEADLKKYNEAVEKYPGGKEAYEQQSKEFEDKLKEEKISLDDYHNISKKIEKKKTDLENKKEEQKRFKESVAKAKSEYSRYDEAVHEEIDGLNYNKEEVEEYRNHLEVKLEGVADLIENNKITRKNLFATTWLLKNECEGKTIDSPEVGEKVLQYIACKQAERSILEKTNNYRIANPEAEGTMIRNLNNGQAVLKLKNDPLISTIFENQMDQPLNMDLVEKLYFEPNDQVKQAVKIVEAKQDLKAMMDEMEEKFGNKPIDESNFRDFVQWKTCETIYNKLDKHPKLLSQVKTLKTDYYANSDILSKESRLHKLYAEAADRYKETFNSVVKNQRAKEEAVKDLPESTKRLMRLKTNYTLKDLDKSVNNLMKHNAKVAKKNAGPDKKVKPSGPVK